MWLMTVFNYVWQDKHHILCNDAHDDVCSHQISLGRSRPRSPLLDIAHTREGQHGVVPHLGLDMARCSVHCSKNTISSKLPDAHADFGVVYTVFSLDQTHLHKITIFPTPASYFAESIVELLKQVWLKAGHKGSISARLLNLPFER